MFYLTFLLRYLIIFRCFCVGKIQTRNQPLLTHDSRSFVSGQVMFVSLYYNLIQAQTEEKRCFGWINMVLDFAKTVTKVNILQCR